MVAPAPSIMERKGHVPDTTWVLALDLQLTLQWRIQGGANAPPFEGLPSRVLVSLRQRNFVHYGPH